MSTFLFQGGERYDAGMYTREARSWRGRCQSLIGVQFLLPSCLVVLNWSWFNSSPQGLCVRDVEAETNPCPGLTGVVGAHGQVSDFQSGPLESRKAGISTPSIGLKAKGILAFMRRTLESRLMTWNRAACSTDSGKGHYLKVALLWVKLKTERIYVNEMCTCCSRHNK